jgi:hypothetical protein
VLTSQYVIVVSLHVGHFLTTPGFPNVPTGQ